jgi:alpha-L-fucosidase 2
MRILHQGRASRWTEALPLGNGRIGAMVFGDPARSRFQLNEETCWSGSPATAQGGLRTADVDGPSAVARMRDALATGDIDAANRAEFEMQMGFSQAYQPLGDLVIRSSDADAADVRRTLDLDEAIATTEWRTPTGRLRETSWVSAADDVLVVERAVVDGSPFDAEISLSSPHPTAEHADPLQLFVRMPSGIARTEGGERPVYGEHAVTALTAVRIEHDGAGEGGSVVGARRMRVVLAVATDARGMHDMPHGDRARLEREAAATLDAASGRDLRIRHRDAHRALWDRTELTLAAPPAEIDAVELLASTAHTGDSALLAQLAFAYGRYLLISSSRPGGLPANLQGIWNDKVLPPWHSNYTTNINLEMNYWPAEAVGLSECHEPLLTWIEELARAGAETASTLYRAPGWVVHHNSDPWGFSVPVGHGSFDPVWSMWPLGAAWLCRHFRERWQFTADPAEARRAWPTIRGAAEFLHAWLVDDDGVRGTSPSTSPENRYRMPDGRVTGLSTSTTSDLAMIRDLFEGVREAADMLGIEDDFTRSLAEDLAALPREQIDAAGRVREWPGDPEGEDPHHRHQSHLYGVLPGETILPWRDDALARAAAFSLDERGPRSTGWSLAWRVGLRARLRDADAAHAALLTFLAPLADPDAPGPQGDAGLYANLFCAHPPFQIDGNFGVTAAITEMIVQSHGGRVAVLPALPAHWPSGRIRGVRVRGGGEVDLAWDGGRATRFELRAAAGSRFAVELDGAVHDIVVPDGGIVRLEPTR